MTYTPSKAKHIFLRIAELVLATGLIWAAAMKLLRSPAALAAIWPWTGQVPRIFVMVTGITDLLGGLGLILPAWLGMSPRWTAAAALGIIALMISAAAFHIYRGEAAQIGINIFFALVAAFVARGRYFQKQTPLEP
jgi:uncharacterized membrane protein